jgi:hypothetical protein
MPTGLSGNVSVVGNTVRLTVTGLAIANDTGMTLAAGTASSITSVQLLTTSSGQPASGITYAVSAIPIHGMLRKNLVARVNGDTFTQTDINSGDISYEHGDIASLSDSFTVTVTDGSQSSGSTFPITCTGSGLSTALQLWWPLDDASGSVAHDDSGNGYAGTLIGSDWSWGTGQVGGDLVFGSGNFTSGVQNSALHWSPSAYSVCWRLNPGTTLNFNEQIGDLSTWNSSFFAHTTMGGDIYTGVLSDNTNGRFTPFDLPAQLTAGTWAGLTLVYPGSSSYTTILYQWGSASEQTAERSCRRLEWLWQPSQPRWHQRESG